MNAKPNQALDNDDDVFLQGVSLEHVIVEVDSLKSEFADIEARLYDQLKLDGQLKSIDAPSLHRATVCVEAASSHLNSYAVTSDVKVAVVTMLLLDIELQYRHFSSLCPRLLGKKASDIGYRDIFVKFFDLIARELARYDKQSGRGSDASFSELSLLEKHIQEEVVKAIAPVNSMIQLILNDYALLSSISGVTKRAHNKDRQRYFKVAKKTREKALQFRSVPNPMSELLGIDIEVNKDEEIASLSKKVDSLEAVNMELQRENIRLKKMLSSSGL
ncbi:hypothetical protein [Alteromonas portus]|uniref:hypothetical protein n=1 Tax=Alteromonas portus TaxID=2565549 RepID=UPI003BF8FFA5